MFPYCMPFHFYFVYLLNKICYPAIYFEESFCFPFIVPLQFSFGETKLCQSIQTAVLPKIEVFLVCKWIVFACLIVVVFFAKQRIHKMLKLTRMFFTHLCFVVGISVFSCNRSHSTNISYGVISSI